VWGGLNAEHHLKSVLPCEVNNDGVCSIRVLLPPPTDCIRSHAVCREVHSACAKGIVPCTSADLEAHSEYCLMPLPHNGAQVTYRIECCTAENVQRLLRRRTLLGTTLPRQKEVVASRAH